MQNPKSQASLTTMINEPGLMVDHDPQINLIWIVSGIKMIEVLYK